jgi:hypothetical protein
MDQNLSAIELPGKPSNGGSHESRSAEDIPCRTSACSLCHWALAERDDASIAASARSPRVASEWIPGQSSVRRSVEDTDTPKPSDNVPSDLSTWLAGATTSFDCRCERRCLKRGFLLESDELFEDATDESDSELDSPRQSWTVRLGAGQSDSELDRPTRS